MGFVQDIIGLRSFAAGGKLLQVILYLIVFTPSWGIQGPTSLILNLGVFSISLSLYLVLENFGLDQLVELISLKSVIVF